MNTLSFFGRFAAETPALEKKVQVISLILSTVVSYLFKFGLISQDVLCLVAGILAGIALLAQFAVKDIDYAENGMKDPSSFLTALPDILNQIYEIKTAVTTKTLPDVDSTVEKLRQLTDPQTTSPITDQSSQASVEISHQNGQEAAQ
ncbi:MAG: hypothetical protein JST50_04750 [Bacteroidetes bacterium]|jgi:hypothetical protein|nr:hypothetical protein [Bacteroidota bacterium]